MDFDGVSQFRLACFQTKLNETVFVAMKKKGEHRKEKVRER